MGYSASSSKDSDSFRKSSAMLKDARDHVTFGFSKTQGVFECDSSLDEYMCVPMKVVRVTRYLSPMKANGYGFGHEFLAVDLRTPEDDQILIRAEKQFIGRNHEKYPPGGLTKATRIADPPKFARENKDRAKYIVHAVLRGSRKILMKDIIDILGACNRCYSVWKHNCCKYAYDTLKKLLEKFAGLADTSDDCKKRILEALRIMPRPSLPAKIFVEAGCVFLALSAVSVLIYGGAVGGIAAFKYLRGLKMVLAAGTTVTGLAGSSMNSAIGLLAKRPWVKCILFAMCGHWHRELRSGGIRYYVGKAQLFRESVTRSHRNLDFSGG